MSRKVVQEKLLSVSGIIEKNSSGPMIGNRTSSIFLVHGNFNFADAIVSYCFVLSPVR